MNRSLATSKRTRSCRRTLGALVLIALIGCESKDSIVDPEPAAPLLPAHVTVVDGAVRWSTDIESRGSVRYGFTSADLDHVAYPVAAGRRDRALLREHEVPLLDLRAGRRVYLQTVDEAPGGPVSHSDLGSFEPGSLPVPALLTATMIHIGFGDSHLITLPNGRRVLIDAGERGAAGAVAQYLDSHGVTTLDAVLSTHVHIDHLGGLVGAFGDFGDGILSRRPAVFLDSPEKSWSRDAYSEAMATLAQAGVRRAVLSRGQTSATQPELAWDERVLVTVLSSGRLPSYVPDRARENDDINNDSIVLKWSYGEVDFIIGGDAEAAAEASMQQAFPLATLEVEYYKAHHHGLPDASTPGWLAVLKPRVGFIPNTQLVWSGNLADAVARTSSGLQALGADVYVIDEAPSLGRSRSSGVQYNVSFVTDGVSYEVRLERATQSVPLKPAAPCIHDDPDLQALFGATAPASEVLP